MDYFGINSAADLPKIREVLAEQMIEPTIVNPNYFTTSIQEQVEDALLIVDANGDLIVHPDIVNETPEEPDTTDDANNEQRNDESEPAQE